MAHSVLLIPVPEADFVVRPRQQRLAPELLPADPDVTVAHITLLGPFAGLPAIDEGLLGELRSFFADVLPFEYKLSSLATFPNGTVYLSPEPASPFRTLTHELSQRFPEYPPYEGAFDDVVPHLTVPMPEDESLDPLRFELDPRLPVTAHAREAALMWWEPGDTHVLETFGFGISAA